MAATFGVLCSVAFVLRFVDLVGHHAPPTIDAGNWLAFGHALLGEHIRSSSIVYPPVVPVLVAGAVAALGATRGVSAVAAAAAIFPGIGVFLALRWAGGRWSSVSLGGLLLFVGSTGEAAAWGGFPQLIGLGLLPLFLIAVDKWVSSGRPGRGLLAGALLMGILATSDIVSGAALVAAAVLLGLRATVSRTGNNGVGASRWCIGAIALVVPCLSFVPLYAHLGNAVLHSLGSRPAAARFPLGSLPGHVDFLYRDFTSFWRIALMVALVTPLLLADRRRQPLWVVSTSLIASSACITIVLREDRFLYVLPTAIVLALAAWFEELGRHHGRFFRRVENGLALALAVALAIQVMTGARLFDAQRRYYMILDPGLVTAIRWIERDTPHTAVIAVPPIRNAPTGWWVEGMGHRLTLIASPLQWLNYADERRRALLANAIFSQVFPDPASLRLAQQDGVSFVLLPRSSDILDLHQVDAYVRLHPASVVFRDQATLVLRVAGA